MKGRATFWLLATAILVGLLPAVNIAWELSHNRMPVPWWWSTKIFGWPGFTMLGFLLGDWWIPTDVADMPLSTHLFRWSVFVMVNTALWVMIAVGSLGLTRGVRIRCGVKIPP